jgi:hypothetical protein
MKALVAVAVLAAMAFPAAQLAQAAIDPPAAPPEITVEAGNKPFLVAHAEGVQIYNCKPTADGYAWSFGGPRANLYDERGKVIATHYAGPTWQARDGSKVIGKLVRPAPITDTSAIAWLLLSANSTSAGPDGARLEGTTFIQRLNTTGGVQPAPGECNAATANTASEIPYTADYVFWKETT